MQNPHPTDVSPLMRGTPPHAVLTSLPEGAPGAHAIVDLRRVLRPPIAPFVTVHLPSIVNARAITELLGHTADTLDAVAAVYLDGSLLQQGASIHNEACTVTLRGFGALRPASNGLPVPAVLHTATALANRTGLSSILLSAAFGAGCTSTSTTTMPAVPIPDTGAASDTMTPGDLATPLGAGSATHAEVVTVTNPDLLDFLRDELAITRVAPEELPHAYTLFDGVLQTRLAAKGLNWGTAECLADAQRRFNHLGPGAEIRLIRDIVEGLPVPQLAATPKLIAHRASAFPIDARPGGICVVDAPRDATLFSLAYQASAACAMSGLHQQIARRDCIVRFRGRPLPPFEPFRAADSVAVWFHDSAPLYFFSQRSAPSPAATEALQEIFFISSSTMQANCGGKGLRRECPPRQASLLSGPEVTGAVTGVVVVVASPSYRRAIHSPGNPPLHEVCGGPQRVVKENWFLVDITKR